jgi:hypothetical protein
MLTQLLRYTILHEINEHVDAVNSEMFTHDDDKIDVFTFNNEHVDAVNSEMFTNDEDKNEEFTF